MKKDLYTISDAAKKIHVETHVLRYWEEELDLKITRNDMGHRLYTKEDIQLFLNIRLLKEQGFLLRAIKLLLPDLHSKTKEELEPLFLLKDELNKRAEAISVPAKTTENKITSKDEKLIILEKFIAGIFESSLQKERQTLCDEMSQKISSNLSEEVSTLLNQHLEKEETHFKQLDILLRKHQKAIKEAAVTDIRKKRGLKIRKISH